MPTASVIMTVKGEPADRMRRVLRSLADQQGLADGVEVLIATDPTDVGTRIETEPAGAVRSVTFVDNPGGARSSGLNLAAHAASTAWVCRVDARSFLSPEHLLRCLDLLAARPDIGVVGGVQRPVLFGAGKQARGIARALANPWALGGAAYRTGRHSGPVDTVYLGTFRRSELLDVGGYDESLDANEDFELCRRYRSTGLAVWLDATLVVGYEPRETLAAIWKQYYAFGRSKVRYWRATGEGPNTRQWLALTLATLAAGAGGVAVVRRPRSLAGLCAATAGALAILDAAGSAEKADTPTRVGSIPAYATLFAAWIGGIATEAVTSTLTRSTDRPARARSAESAP